MHFDIAKPMSKKYKAVINVIKRLQEGKNFSNFHPHQISAIRRNLFFLERIHRIARLDYQTTQAR